MTKRQNTSLIIKAIMLLLALIIMIFTGSLAWYYNSRSVTADGASVTTITSQDFKMAVGFKNRQTAGKGDDGYVVSEFTKYFDLTNIEIKDDTTNETTSYKVLQDVKPIDLTGDGITLVRPTLKDRNSAIDTQNHEHTIGRPNEEYIAFDLFFQSPEMCQIYLDNKTKVLGFIEQQGESLVNDADSTISPDAIIGALRVAFTDYSVDDYGKQDMNYNLVYTDGENEGKVKKTNDIHKDGEKIGQNKFTRTAPNALWIPRADIRYDDTDTPVLYTEITNEMSEHAAYETDGRKMNTFWHTFYAYDNGQGGYKEFDDKITGTITGINKDDIVICDVIHEGVDDEGKKCYYGKVHVKIWIEGCDSEARRVMNSGKFIIDMELLSKEYEKAN